MSPAYAVVTITTSNIPSTITDESFTINVSVSGASAGTNYLRIDLYKENTTNYFGETYNNTSWYGGSTGTQYFPITIVSGQTWSGTVQGKVGTPTSTEYLGSGAYKLKIRRYTSSGSPTSNDQQTPQDITINISSSSPSPSPSTISTFTISNVPSSIDSTQTFTISVNLELSSNPSTKFYLKGAFIKSGNTNYFGLTKVNNFWIKNGTTYSSQYEITADSAGKWSGNLEIQPDVMDSGYEGTNDYIFKVGRYSASGSGPTWSNEIKLKINAKEVEMSEGAVNLSGLSSPKSSTVLGESKIQEDLPEIVYSLEKYQKSTPAARKTSSPSAKVKIASQKIPVLFYIMGGVLIFAAGAATVYIHEKIRN